MRKRRDSTMSVCFCDACGRVSSADQRRQARLEAARLEALAFYGARR